MLNIFICEDDPRQRKLIETFVNKYIIIEDYDMSITLSTDNPTTLLSHVENRTESNGLYFLDVDLQHELNGIELGAKIRMIDISATIVFITTHFEMAHLVFVHKVEAMEYIIKDDIKKIETGIMECMQLAYRRYLDGKHSQHKYFTVRADDQVWNILYDDVLYFETNVSMHNKLILHTENGQIGFRSSINEVVSSAPEFYCCHKSFAVNPKKIRHIDRVAKTAEMVNGDLVPVAVRKMSELVRIVG